MNMKKRYMYIGYLTYRGVDAQHHKLEILQAIKKITALAKKHARVCEWACNGRKWNSDRGPEYTQEMFEIDAEKIKTSILKTLQSAGMTELDWAVNFQNDPRGATVKLYYRADNRLIDLTELLYF